VPRFHRTWPDGCRIKQTDGCLLFLLSTGMALPACYVVAPVDSERTGFPRLCVVLYRISNRSPIRLNLLAWCISYFYSVFSLPITLRSADDVRLPNFI